jgi:hypothetical protein
MWVKAGLSGAGVTTTGYIYVTACSALEGSLVMTAAETVFAGVFAAPLAGVIVGYGLLSVAIVGSIITYRNTL